MEKIWIILVCGLLKGLTSEFIGNTKTWSFFAYGWDKQSNLSLPADYKISNSFRDESIISFTLRGTNTRFNYLSTTSWDGICMTFDKYKMPKPYETLIQDSIINIGYNPSDTTFCIIRSFKDLNFIFTAFRVCPESVSYFIETLQRATITQCTQTNINDPVSVSIDENSN